MSEKLNKFISEKYDQLCEDLYVAKVSLGDMVWRDIECEEEKIKLIRQCDKCYAQLDLLDTLQEYVDENE